VTAAALPLAAGTRPWSRHLGALAIVATLILALFSRDAGDLARIWWTSTTFGHCLFIGPVVGWLVWQRRVQLAQLEPSAWWPGLLLVAGGAVAWLLGDAGSLALARQLGLVVMVQGAVVTLLGPSVARGLLFPLAYALFLVPFGDQLEPPLQAATVRIVLPLLHVSGIPASVDGVLIHAGRYYFEVAEACSGAKFVIAMAAFGVLVAGTCFRSWARRAAFMIVAVVVPVLANGVRAFGTIWAADQWSLEAATGFDHIVYGWVFFGLVMAGVLVLGWRWFDRAPDDAAFDPSALAGIPKATAPLGLTAAAVVLLAATMPAWSAVTAQSAKPLPAHVDLPRVTGWTRVPLDTVAPWQPYYPGADHLLIGRYANGRDTVELAIAAFVDQREGRELVSFGTGTLREEDRWVRVADLSAPDGGTAMRITAAGPVERIVATWYRVGGTMATGGVSVKLATMRARLGGDDRAAVALHVSTRGHDPAPIARFLAAAGTPEQIIAAAIERR
jgi:exosortase A